MKALELIKQLQENQIEDTDDFEILCHLGHDCTENKIFTIAFTFWHENKLYLAVKEINE